MDAALLLLADSRLPAGTHAHSSGLETAVARGDVRDTGTLAEFLAGRLHTVGLTAGGLAAAAWSLADADRDEDAWRSLDAEADARTPAPPARAASRAQGRGLVRAAGAGWPAAAWSRLTAATDGAPHHACALGVAAHAAGSNDLGAALLAVSGAASGPASAAVRLLSLDPFAVTAVLADLAPAVDVLAAESAAAARAAAATGGWRELPARGAPLLDLHAQAHARAEVRFFAS